MMGIVAAIVLLLAGAGPPPPDRWTEAEQSIRRLPPSAFPHLSAGVRTYLVRRGCTVPQAWHNSTPHNVVQGGFLRRGGKDWAVLCSLAGKSAILVFRGGQARPAAELAAGNDVSWVQQVDGDGRVGYSRALSAVGRRYILGHHEAFGSPLPRPLDHEGIEDYFEGKASIIHYYSNGRWMELTGMD